MSQPPFGQRPHQPGSGSSYGGEPGGLPPEQSNYAQGGQSYGAPKPRPVPPPTPQTQSYGPGYGQGRQPSYGPGQYGQGQYRQGQQQYGQPRVPAPEPLGGVRPAPPQGAPAPSAKGPNLPVLIGVGVALLAIVGGLIAYFALRSNDPVAVTTPTVVESAPSTQPASPDPSSSPASTPPATGTGFTVNGTSLAGSNFTTTLPAGWRISKDNGLNNQGELTDARTNLITYYDNLKRPATNSCRAGIETVRVTPSDKVEEVALTWAGKSAVGYEITVKRAAAPREEVYSYYCVDRDSGGSVSLSGLSWVEDQATVRAGVFAMAEAWVWN